MQRPEDGSDVTGFVSFDNSTCKRVLDLLEPGDLTLEQVVIKRVAVVELGVNNGSGDGGGCFGIEVRMDTSKLTNLVIAGVGDRCDLIRKGEVFIEYEAEVSSRLGGTDPPGTGQCGVFAPLKRIETFCCTVRSKAITAVTADCNVSCWPVSR